MVLEVFLIINLILVNFIIITIILNFILVQQKQFIVKAIKSVWQILEYFFKLLFSETFHNSLNSICFSVRVMVMVLKD